MILNCSIFDLVKCLINFKNVEIAKFFDFKILSYSKI